MEMTNKTCAKCGVEIPRRKKFCSDSCKWWFNSIKRGKESHLPPFKKRNRDWCQVYVRIGNTIRGRGQGKRSGGMVQGSMSANVQYEIAEWMPFTFDNVKLHFTEKNGNPHIPFKIGLGDGTRLTKDEAETYLINQDSAMAAAHG